MNYRVRVLGTADAHDYQRVRLAALRLHPEAFGSAYEDEAVLGHAQIVERLSTPGLIRFGGFADGTLVGLSGLALQSGAKQRHKAGLFSMYVEAAHRRSGLAQRLVGAVIAGARDAGARVLHLSVTVGNAPAQLLYRRMGFVVYGVERRALLVDDVFYDEELMALDLDGDGRTGTT
jgi:ribosomal protein S18 acetylase RimI-like enzyme